MLLPLLSLDSLFLRLLLFHNSDCDVRLHTSGLIVFPIDCNEQIDQCGHKGQCTKNAIDNKIRRKCQ